MALGFKRRATRRDAIPMAINAIPEKNRIVFRQVILAMTLGGQAVGGHAVRLVPTKPEMSGTNPKTIRKIPTA